MRTSPFTVVFVLAAAAGLFFAGFSTHDFVEHLDRQVHSIHCSFIPGLTNPDASRSYVAIYLHENRLYVLDATVAKGQPPPLIFQQSFAMLGPDGNNIRYQSLYYNRFPERQLGGRGGRGGGDRGGGAGDAGRGGAPPQGGQGRQ